jgi:hypothetical protein
VLASKDFIKPFNYFCQLLGGCLTKTFPKRSAASTRIWLIFTHDCFGSLADFNSNVSGNRARCGWLVMATAITVPDRSLNTSWSVSKTKIAITLDEDLVKQIDHPVMKYDR